jgi:hypothetical protein
MGDDPAHEAGLQAVAGATDPNARYEPTASGETAHQAGLSAVDAEMDRVTTEQFRDKMATAKNAKRAGKAGEAAVAEAVQPTPAEEAQILKAWNDRMAFDKSIKGLSEPERVRAIIARGKGEPGYGPREGALYAKAFGPAAVEQALKPGPLPMTPPGQAFGPHSVVNPETISTQPSATHTDLPRFLTHGKEAEEGIEE